MRLFSKSRKDKKAERKSEKPKCELKFEKNCEEVQGKLLSRFYYWGGNGIVMQDYFPAQNGWVKPYLMEEELGFAILQRYQRLIEQHPLEQQKTSGPDNMPPEYNSVIPSILAEEIQKLRGEYWKHQRSMSLLDAVKPINSAPVQEQMVLRKHRDRHGRPYSWVMGQERCAASGGCCGRGCGCCEKALDQYLSPARNPAQESKETTVFGHCTVECRCCIDHRGCYIPDAHLPPPVL